MHACLFVTLSASQFVGPTVWWFVAQYIFVQNDKLPQRIL